jgi:hypothetical protein
MPALFVWLVVLVATAKAFEKQGLIAGTKQSKKAERAARAA